MSYSNRWLCLALSLCVLAFGGSKIWRAKAASQKVVVLRTPNGGIQPRAVVHGKGVVHLIYYKGDAGSGDIFYVQSKPGQDNFSPPMRVNSQPGSAIAAGTIRGGQIAIGKDGRVHVGWNGTGNALPKNPNGGSPFLYTRLNDAKTAFEPQRNLMQCTTFLDGGGTIAADQAGNVYASWHGKTQGDSDGEEARRVWIARSTDEGKAFSREVSAFTQQTGVCPCCSTHAFADSQGTVYVFYRSATAQVNRDMVLLHSQDKGQSFDGAVIHKWRLNT